MFPVRDANSQGDEHSKDKQNVELGRVDEIELALTRLFEAGELELPENERPIVEHIEPSEEAKRIGKRVRERILSRLGHSNLGAYLSRERESKGIQKKEVARRVKLALDTLTQLEANQVEFFRLSPAKAADLVQFLELDPTIVLRHLAETGQSQQPSQTPAPFFRIDKAATEEQRLASQRKSEEALVGQDDHDSLEKFLTEFRQELVRRGLLNE